MMPHGKLITSEKSREGMDAGLILYRLSRKDSLHIPIIILTDLLITSRLESHQRDDPELRGSQQEPLRKRGLGAYFGSPHPRGISFGNKSTGTLRTHRKDTLRRKTSCQRLIFEVEDWIEATDMNDLPRLPEGSAFALASRAALLYSPAEIAARRDRERRYKSATRYNFRDGPKDPRPNQGPQVVLKADNSHDLILKTPNFAERQRTRSPSSTQISASLRQNDFFNLDPLLTPASPSWYL